MTGAILGGSSVQQAARLQIIIIFMISSSTALASIMTTFSTIAITVDWQHRIRTDRIYENDHVVWRVKDWSVKGVGQGFTRLTTGWRGWRSWQGMGKEKVSEVTGERRPLLGWEVLRELDYVSFWLLCFAFFFFVEGLLLCFGLLYWAQRITRHNAVLTVHYLDKFRWKLHHDECAAYQSKPLTYCRDQSVWEKCLGGWPSWYNKARGVNNTTLFVWGWKVISTINWQTDIALKDMSSSVIRFLFLYFVRVY